jgi:hypothetical protein
MLKKGTPQYKCRFFPLILSVKVLTYFLHCQNPIMMKKQCLSIVFYCIVSVSYGQFCPYASANQRIQTNGVNAKFSAGGFLQDGVNGDYAFFPYFKTRPSPATILVSNLWFVGKTGTTRKASADYYRNERFASGPINDVTRLADAANCGKWDKYWTVSRAEIEAHQRDFADNGRIDNPIKSIMAWPAVGNPNSLQLNGLTLSPRITNRSYAPFRDVDNDGIYNPMKGDFPAIFSVNTPQPDMIAWGVFNDLGARQSMTFEIQATIYGFECADTAQVLNNSLFTSFKIINHGTTDIDSFKVGLFADMEAGCYFNNYFGCDTTLNASYVYSQDSVIDAANSCTSSPIYRASTPVQAISFLNQPLTSYRTFVNSTIGNPLSATIFPFSLDDYFNYFNGKWKDGTPLTRGGSGYNIGSTNTTNFAFPNDPTEVAPSAWSMLRTNLPTVYGYATLAISDLNKIGAGETKTLDVVYSAHRRVGRNAWQNVKTMREDLTQIRQFYQNPTTASLCARTPLCEGGDCVWAGDANKDGIANYRDLLPIGVAHSQTGAARNGNVVWSPKTVSNWNTTFSDGNFNAKHIDCDGNGVIDLSDIEVTKANSQLTKPDFQRSNDIYTEGSPLTMSFNRNVDSLVYSAQSYYNFTGKVNLSTTLDLFGIAFEIEYDPYFLKLVGPASSIAQASSLPIAQMLDSSRTNVNKAQLEFSRLGFNFSGPNMPLIQFQMGVNETIINWPTNTTFLKFKNIKGIKRDGTIIPLGGTTQRVRFPEILSNNKDVNASQISIFPNPTTGETTINWGKMEVKTLRVSNAMGQVVLERHVANAVESTVLSLQDYPTGVYFLQIQTVENKIAVRKLILAR